MLFAFAAGLMTLTPPPCRADQGPVQQSPDEQQVMLKFTMFELLPGANAVDLRALRKALAKASLPDHAVLALKPFGTLKRIDGPSVYTDLTREASVNLIWDAAVQKSGAQFAGGSWPRVENDDEPGLRLTMRGQWLDRVHPDRAYLHIAAAWRYLHRPKGLFWGREEWRTLESEHHLAIANGQGAWLVFSHAGHSGPPKIVNLYHVRVDRVERNPHTPTSSPPG
jgi:hypothetical protein